MTRFGAIEVDKGHVLAQGRAFRMSAYLQELLTYVGESMVFAEASQLINKLVHIQVNAKQVERLCHYYGALLEEASTDQGQDAVKQDATLHYGMIDGGMILTREESWKELKVGRVFPAQAVVAENEHRNFIYQSDYVAHLGSQQDFFDKLSYKIDHLPNMIWIADGAKWIWNWIQAHHPNAVQILDYYHCKEKLCRFALYAFRQDKERKEWVERQEDLLFADAVETVMANIVLMPLKAEAKRQQQSLLQYYSNNKDRMRYGTYQEKGYLIGSGAVEAAIRQVIQQRLKLSGQRWTMQGAQQVANLRIMKKSNQWNAVKQLISQNA